MKNSEAMVDEKTIEKIDADLSEISFPKTESESDPKTFSVSANSFDADSDLKADFSSDRTDCPPCHAVEMGSEKVIVAFEKGSSGDMVSGKGAENVEGNQRVTEFSCKEKKCCHEGQCCQK
jgi:hypothetical protein